MKLKDLVDINPVGNGKLPNLIAYIDTSSVADGELTNIQYLQDTFPSRAQRKISNGDILISSVRPNLKHNYYVQNATENMIASTGFIQIRVKNNEKVDSRFLYYWLTSPSKISHYCRIADCSQSSYPSFSKEVIEELDFPSIPLVAQHSITNILGTIDTKIDLNKKIANNLERLANDYLDYYFSTHETRKTTLSTVISHEKYSVVDGPFGTQMKVEDYCSEGIPILEMDYLEGGTIYSKIKHFISDIKYEEVKRSTARPGDLIISKTGTLGLLGVVPESIDRAIIVSRLAKITPNISIISPYVLLLLLKRVAKAKYWERQSSGSTMPILNIDIIKNAPIVIATEMMPLNETINKFYRKIDNVLSENIKLLGLKNMILPLLMNGQAHLN